MSARHENNLLTLHARMLSTLKRVRTAQSRDDLSAEFYIALGLFGAAVTLDAITLDASDRLHGLVLNASQHRANELTHSFIEERKAVIEGATA